MMIESVTVAPEERSYTYYGLEYRFPVEVMASQANLSVRTIKTWLKLQGMGYGDKIMQGWTAAECFAHAGVGAKRKPAPRRESIDEFKTAIIYLRGQVHEGEDEIERLREMLLDLGVDPDDD